MNWTLGTAQSNWSKTKTAILEAGAGGEVKGKGKAKDKKKQDESDDEVRLPIWHICHKTALFSNMYGMTDQRQPHRLRLPSPRPRGCSGEEEAPP